MQELERVEVKKERSIGEVFICVRKLYTGRLAKPVDYSICS